MPFTVFSAFSCLHLLFWLVQYLLWLVWDSLLPQFKFSIPFLYKNEMPMFSRNLFLLLCIVFLFHFTFLFSFTSITFSLLFLKQKYFPLAGKGDEIFHFLVTSPIYFYNVPFCWESSILHFLIFICSGWINRKSRKINFSFF